MTFQFTKRKWAPAAQTATELAIFGAILIFVLGLIIRYAVSFQYGQNQSLEAMRLAFEQSFIGAQNNTAARSFASVLFIEDRKDVDVTGSVSVDGRYGSLNRSAQIAGGSGTFTHHLFLPTDPGEGHNLPVSDIFINGKHFVFSVGRFMEYSTPVIPSETFSPCNVGNFGGGLGCPIFYARITNFNDDFRCPNPAVCSFWNPLVDIERFNLDRIGTPDVRPDLLSGFAWQWKPVYATTENIKINDGSSISYDVDGDLKEEQILTAVGAGGRVSQLRSSLDAFDLSWSHSAENMCAPAHQAITKVYVIDAQEGDLDLTYDTWDAEGLPTPASPEGTNKPRPGLTNRFVMYTKPGPQGTYFLIEEGKLYDPDTRQFIRSVQKHDQIDIIERAVQLSNDTGNMCNGTNGNVLICCQGSTCTATSSNLDPVVNGDCFSGDNIHKTCFDRDEKILYVRSNIEDKTGKKWITDVSSDTMPVE